jgi:hypothetical protein
MRQFAATAHVYRGRLGDDAAFTAARLLAAEIENPALSTMLGDPMRSWAPANGWLVGGGNRSESIVCEHDPRANDHDRASNKGVRHYRFL